MHFAKSKYFGFPAAQKKSEKKTWNILFLSNSKMSRHRNFQNAHHEDYDEDPEYNSSYASSYTDEVALSRSLEQEYVFRRGGNTPKLNHYFGRTNSVSSVPEEDEDIDKGHEADSDDSSSQSRYDFT